MARNTIKNIDITKTGPQGFRQLQAANDLEFEGVDPEIVNIIKRNRGAADSISLYDPYADATQEVSSSLSGTTTPWGESIFDDNVATEQQFQHLGDVRANNEPWYAKLGAGIGKGVVLAGTTFIDGTVGLLYGAGSAIANIGNENETGWQTFSRLWDNEISNGMRKINELSEEWMPNYRTEAEMAAPWYKNLGTVNFWADGVIKNMGFMVGAVYSGGLLTKGISFLGKLSKLGELSTMGSRITGSILSGTNEARIEANHNGHDWEQLEIAKLQDAYKELTGIEDIESMEQDPLYQEQLKGIEERKAKMGAVDFFSNVPMLIFNDFYQYGRLYARGFSASKQLTQAADAVGGGTKNSWLNRLKNIEKEGLRNELRESSRIIMEDGKYAAKKLTPKEIISTTLTTGAREGFEEMNQQWAANTAGNMYAADGPDAYYNAMIDPNSQIQAKDFMSSLTKSFAEVYGDQSQWEQFAIGAISGIIGTPTFGVQTNSSENTILGRGKAVGWSGGALGEISSRRAEYQRASEDADVMNKVKDRLESKFRYYTQSNSFTNAMDGFSAENDKFEFKNAEENLDFASIQAFSREGRLDDLKVIVNQDFENMSNEELAKIAMFTSKTDDKGNPVGWQTLDGHPMVTIDEEGNPVITDENAEYMRQKLEEKRKATLSKIDSYTQALNVVKAIGNQNLTDAQTNELAWLWWKSNQFKGRYNSVKNEHSDVFNSLLKSLNNWEEALTEERKFLFADTKKDEKGEIIEDLDSENTKVFKENTRILNNVRAVKSFIEAVISNNNPLLLNSFLEEHPEFRDFLKDKDAYDFLNMMSDKSGSNFAEFTEAMQALIDTERLANAAKTFNDRYKEFSTNPSIVENKRAKDRKRKEDNAKTATNLNKKEAVSNAKVSDIVQQIEEGEDFDGLFDDINSEPVPSADEVVPVHQGKAKVKEAKAIVDNKNTTLATLQKQLQKGTITQQQYDNAVALLNNATQKSESIDEFEDLSSFAYNDVQVLPGEQVDTSQFTPEELNDFANNQLEEAKTVIANARAETQEIAESVKDIPDALDDLEEVLNEDKDGAELQGAREAQQNNSPTSNQDAEVGHDATPKTTTVNQQEAEKKLKEKDSNLVLPENTNLANAIEEEAKSTLPEEIFGSSFPKIHEDATNLAAALKEMKDNGTPVAEAINTVKDSQAMSNLNKVKPTDLLLSIINDFFNGKYQATNNQEVESKSEESAVESTDPMLDTDITTINKDIQQANSTPTSGTLQYWKPTTTEVPISWTKGNITPFYQTARTLKDAQGNPKYSPAQLARFEALYNYLNTHNAWENAFNIKEGDEVKFITDPELNEKTGEITILMEVNGKIAGDLGSKNDPVTQNQVGIISFINRFEDKYNAWKADNNTGKFTFNEVSQVDKKMIGKVPFSNFYSKLNILYTDYTEDGQINNLPFKLGIQTLDGSSSFITMTAGRKLSEGPTKEERTIVNPLKSKRGNIFLLMPTGSSKRAYIPVPVMTDRYAENTEKTALGREVDRVLNRLTTIKKGEEMSIMTELQELLYIPTMHINILDNGDVKITMMVTDDTKQTTLYQGKIGAPNMIENIKKMLYNVPFQVSRKYINTTYKNGADYNRMLGDVMSCNIEGGYTHTINSWFTIKPVTEEGIQKGKSPKSRKVNPTSRNKAYTQFTYSNSKGTHVIAIDNTNYTAYEATNPSNDNTGLVLELVKGQNDPTIVVFKATTEIENKGLLPNKEGLIVTSFGLFDPSKAVFVNTNPTQPQQDTTSETTLQGVDPKFKDSPNPPVISDEDTKAIISTLNDYIAQVKGKKELTLNELNHIINSVKKYYETLITDTSKIKEIHDLIIQAKNKNELEKTLAEHPEWSNTWKIVQKYDEFFVTSSDKEIELTSSPQQPSNQAPQQPQSDNQPKVDTEALKKRLLNNAAKKKVWENLTTAQQETILAHPQLIASRILQELSTNFKNGMFIKPVDPVFDKYAKPREVTSEPYQQINLNKEIKWLGSVLPQMATPNRVKVVEGIIKLSGYNRPIKAWGQFKQGVIIISKQAARGTVYHEAFHAVANTLMSEKELNTMFSEARKKYGNINKLALEEKLAEDFRKYVQFEDTPILGNLVKFYRTLKHLVKSLLGKETYLDNLFYRINRGKYKNITPKSTKKSRNRVVDDVNSINEKLQSIKEQYTKAQMAKSILNSYSNIYRKETDNYIKEIGLSDVAYSYSRPDTGRWYIGIISKNNYNERVNDLNNRINNIWYNELDEDSLLSNQALQEQEDAEDTWEREFEQYNREKFMPYNLNAEDIEYLKQRGLSMDDYNNMTQIEKEFLFHCKR